MKHIEQNQSVIVATKKSLCRLNIPARFLPQPLPLDSDFLLLLALSICHFVVVQARLNMEVPTLDTFRNCIEAEACILSAKIPQISVLVQCFNALPPAWRLWCRISPFI
jgi:hypothetical protein